MKEYIFSEKSTIERMINAGFVDPNNICKTIRCLARYNYYALGLESNDNYNEINDYMRKNCEDYSEVGFYKSINGCIKDVGKSTWRDISEVIITKEEMDIIASLNNDEQERIAFVLLADAKYYDIVRGTSFGLSYLTTTDIFSMARVSMPLDKRLKFLHFLYENDFIEMNFNPKKTHKRIKYMSKDNNEPAVVLKESNYKELAYTYLNYKYGGYKECKSCKRLIKIRKNSKYCKDCAPVYKKIEFKVKKCIDCGTEFSVDARNNTKCRCNDCQHEKVKADDRKRKQISAISIDDIDFTTQN